MLPTLFYGRHISERIAELSNRFIFNYTKRYFTVRISMQPVKKKKKSPKASCVDQLPPQNGCCRARSLPELTAMPPLNLVPRQSANMLIPMNSESLFIFESLFLGTGVPAEVKQRMPAGSKEHDFKAPVELNALLPLFPPVHK